MGKDVRGRLQSILLCFGLAIALAGQIAGEAAAAKRRPMEDQMGPPMRFAVVRSATAGCEPVCPEWISAEGTILQQTPAELKKLLKKLGDKRLPIIVTSPGGQVEAAWQLGRMIRARNLDIGVGLTRFIDCAPGRKDCKLDPARNGVYSGYAYAAGAYCASACSLMFAGGVRRYVGQWAYMGVHQVTSYYTKQQVTYKTTYRVVNGKKRAVGKKIVGRKNVSSYSTTKMGKQLRSQMLAYLKEMGIKQTMFDAGQGTPASDMRKLAPVEMLGMNLVTSLDAADILVRSELCKSVPAAANCVEMLPPDSLKPYPKAIVPKGPQMWFAVVRSSEAGCEPHCPEWISAEGDIDPRSPQRLAAMLKALDGRKLPMVVSSKGGDTDASMVLGRLIRKNGMGVAVGSTVFAGCKPRDDKCATAGRPPFFGNAVSGGSECTADCLLILAAGHTRIAGYGALVGWQQAGRVVKPAVAAYLKEMDVKPAAFERAPAKLDDVARTQLFSQYLITRTTNVDLFVDGGICRAIPKPANCRTARTGEFSR